MISFKSVAKQRRRPHSARSPSQKPRGSPEGPLSQKAPSTYRDNPVTSNMPHAAQLPRPKGLRDGGLPSFASSMIFWATASRNPSGSARGTDQSRSLDWLKFRSAVRRRRTGEVADDHAHHADDQGQFCRDRAGLSSPSNASPAARPDTGAPSTIRHRRLKRSAAAVSGQRGSGLLVADAQAGAKARDGEFA